ncbi:MAG: TetR/AcrR family transcriptional regulator, partial [Thiotrichales bacterium]|nr:TetR/AcrR family transcriptional regulator [Thiotrichales bacterium]
MKPAENTQQKILHAANDLFYHQGYNHTSIGDIVKVTGLSKGNITYHFKSKQDILKGVIHRRLTNIEQLLSQWDAEETDPASKLLRFCDMLIDEQKDLSRYGCPLGTLT